MAKTILFGKSYMENKFFTPENVAKLIRAAVNRDAGYNVLGQTRQEAEAAEVGLGYAPPFQTIKITFEVDDGED